MRNDRYVVLALLLLASGGSSLLHRFPQAMAHGAPALLYAAGIAAAAALGTAALVLLSRARTLEDTPLSRARSAAQGYVELEGHARLLPGPEIVSPLSRERCVWWDMCVWYTDPNEDDAREELLDRDTSDSLFVLADTTGEVIVDPHGAQVMPSVRRQWRGATLRPGWVPKPRERTRGPYRYREQLIRVGDVIHAAGWHGAVGALTEFDESRETSELLRGWKQDPGELLKRFDANHDGVLQPQEWEEARRAARDEVRAQHVQEAARPNVSVLAQPRDGRLFLLSTLTQEQLTRRMRLKAAACLAGCVALILILHAAWQMAI